MPPPVDFASDPLYQQNAPLPQTAVVPKYPKVVSDPNDPNQRATMVVPPPSELVPPPQMLSASQLMPQTTGNPILDAIQKFGITGQNAVNLPEGQFPGLQDFINHHSMGTSGISPAMEYINPGLYQSYLNNMYASRQNAINEFTGLRRQQAQEAEAVGRLAQGQQTLDLARQKQSYDMDVARAAEKVAQTIIANGGTPEQAARGVRGYQAAMDQTRAGQGAIGVTGIPQPGANIGVMRTGQPGGVGLKAADQSIADELSYMANPVGPGGQALPPPSAADFIKAVYQKHGPAYILANKDLVLSKVDKDQLRNAATSPGGLAGFARRAFTGTAGLVGATPGGGIWTPQGRANMRSSVQVPLSEMYGDTTEEDVRNAFIRQQLLGMQQ